MNALPTRWLPSPNVRGHNGAALSAEAVFFAAPPPEIGNVLTAHSGVYRTGSAMQQPLARKVVGLFTLFGLVVGSFLGIGFARGSLPGALVGGLVGGGVIGGLIYRREGRKRDCTYTGTHGIARCKYPSTSRPDVLLFANAVELQTAFLGRSMGTNFNFQWRDSSGKTLYKLEGGYYGNKRDHDPEALYHFAVAAERAWSDFRLPTVRAELQRQGCVRFLLSQVLGNRRYASLGRGYLEFSYGDRPVRLRAEEIEDVLVYQGLITIRRHGAKERTIPTNNPKDGIFHLSYGTIANVRLFLLLLEQVVGVSCRYVD